MAVVARTSPRYAELLLEVFCERFPAALDDVVEMRVDVDPDLVLKVGVDAGSAPGLPSTLPGHEGCRIEVFESDARAELL